MLDIQACEQMGLVAIRKKNFHCITAVTVGQEFKDVLDNKLDNIIAAEVGSSKICDEFEYYHLHGESGYQQRH